MNRRFWLLALLLIYWEAGWAQKVHKDALLDDLAFNADVMINAVMDQHRIRAHDQFMSSIDSFLSRPRSYGISLDSIAGISVVHGDGFRIVTWQLRLSDKEYKYGGFIQWPEKVVELKDTRPWLNGSNYSIYTPGAWYGCIYYKIIPFESKGKKFYVLFGFNAENNVFNTKVADILDLTGDEPRFGAPIFTGKDDGRTRVILTYGDVSSVQLIYDPELKAIVYDHLESLAGIGPSGEDLPVSDGSMEGWFLKNGEWVYQEKVYDVKMDQPPMTDERKNYKEDKDIFGRPKKP